MIENGIAFAPKYRRQIIYSALLYLRIYLLGMPVILLYNFEAAIFRSVGDTRVPLIALATSGVLNVVLNLFFVAVLRMTVNGVAIATVISNANLLTSGKMNAYLADIDRQAEELFLRLVKQMADADGITEKLKACDQMKWVGRMNSIRDRVTEIVNNELILI